jgi:hypothetical protein
MNSKALKARDRPRFLYYAHSALLSLGKGIHLGRWPRLLHFAPLVLTFRVFTQALRRAVP